MAKEIEFEVVKAKYLEFVQEFLSAEEGTEKIELLPNWGVHNKKHNFKATIECEFRVKDLRTMEREWFAVVNHDGEKSNFLIEF